MTFFATVRRSPLLVLVALALGGCPTTVTCSASEVFDGNRCVPADGGPGTDAGSDAAGDDAGPCGTACEAPTPFCDEATGECVECLGESDCTAPDLACVAGSCEACDDNADCTEVDASVCDTTSHTCGGCAADGDCEHLTATPVCDEAASTCVACTADDETLCGGNVCDVATGSCTTTPAGSVGVCLPCTSNRACATGTVCVLQRFDEPPVDGTLVDVGYVCLPMAAGTCTAGTAPFISREALADASGASVAVCSLGLATCPAYLDYRTTECTTDADCGVDGVDDGVCRMGSPDTASGRACTTRCNAASDCSGVGCSSGTPPRYCCFGASCT